MLSAAELTDDQRERVAELADRVYRHVLRVVDLGRLFQLEQCLWCELAQLDIEDESGGVATALLAEALRRVGHSPERHVTTIPPGVGADEVMAAEYDDDCAMCRYEADDFEYRMSGRRCQDLERDAADPVLRQLVERSAEAWRAEHIEALRRFGLAEEADGGADGGGADGQHASDATFSAIGVRP
jgi:hypothetical protein